MAKYGRVLQIVYLYFIYYIYRNNSFLYKILNIISLHTIYIKVKYGRVKHYIAKHTIVKKYHNIS